MTLTFEPWARDDDAFQAQFGIKHADFCELILALTQEQQEIYERTCQTNAKAAILWAIHEGKSHGMLVEGSDEDE